MEVDQHESTQLELRCSVRAEVVVEVDKIKYPRNLDKGNDEVYRLWSKMSELEQQILQAARFWRSGDYITKKSNLRKKTGPAERKQMVAEIALETGNALLFQLCGPRLRGLKKVPGIIADLQREQKSLVKEMRAANGRYLAAKKKEGVERAEANQRAITNGEFWECEEDFLKEYFQPPFNKRKLVDVSEEWRAALFMECESYSYRRDNAHRSNRWGHMIVPTGNAYLCGIDDNGDEWGHEVDIRSKLSWNKNDYGYESHYNMDATVEDAMELLFDHRPDSGVDARQGDLLFVPIDEKDLPDRDELPEVLDAWTVRESHTVEGRGLRRNGTRFYCPEKIFCRHTSHAEIVLAPGCYEIYPLLEEMVGDFD